MILPMMSPLLCIFVALQEIVMNRLSEIRGVHVAEPVLSFLLKAKEFDAIFEEQHGRQFFYLVSLRFPGVICDIQLGESHFRQSQLSGDIIEDRPERAAVGAALAV